MMPRMVNRWGFGLAVLGLCAAALAAPPPKAKAKGAPAQKIDLGLPSMGELPKGDNLHKPKADDSGKDTSSVKSEDATYAVVRVQHAKGFTGGAGGLVPVGAALEAVNLEGKPPSTERFSTLIRVKSPQRVAAPIDVVILDPRGATALSASGKLSFRATKGDEVDYAIDWESTPCRSGGDYSVLVRVAGKALGTYPLKVIEAKK